MKRRYRILHWLLFVTFLGLVITSLAAEFFFSKKAIMQSFEYSLSILEITIPPADQFFIAQVARRNTWDWHFGFGVLFAVLFYMYFLLNKQRLNVVSFGLLGIGTINLLSGFLLYARLYYKLQHELFSLLKYIHFYSVITFTIILIIHIYIKSKKGVIYV